MSNPSFANATTLACALASTFLYYRLKQAAAPPSVEKKPEESKLKGVNQTALMIAAARAIETAKPAETRLFSDPYALPMCQTSLENIRKRMEADDIKGSNVEVLSIRTLYIDREIAKAVDQGVRQVVNLGAGLDTRAYRLNLPADLTFFELDMEPVIKYKNTILQNNHAKPTCKRVPLIADLTARDETKHAHDLTSNTWVLSLLTAGFDPKAPAFFLLEGLVSYFEKDQVEHLLGTINSLVSPGSFMLVNTLHSSFLKVGGDGAAAAARMKERGAQWKFTCDDPSTLVKSQGFNCISSMTMRQVGEYCGPLVAERLQGANQIDSYYFTLCQKMVSASTLDETD